tara:strand:- start:9285 stop:11192 length:1908 start_codon:yes stop_codon:yes gene_type:complete
MVFSFVYMNAQEPEIQQFEGSLQLGEFIGEAKYEYKIAEGDTLRDGAFQMNRSNLQALLDEEDSSFSFTGAFKDNVPEGFWRFQFGEFQSDSKTQVVDIQYQVKVSGRQEVASGVIKDGKPHGKWTYTIDQIKDSEVEKLLFKSTIDFEEGIPQRSFRIENDSSTLVGRFLRNGLAHDEWSLFVNTDLGDTENWIFNDGILQVIEQQKNGLRNTIRVFDDTPKTTKTINLDSRYIKALQLQRSISDGVELFDKGIPRLLGENVKYYQKLDAILTELGESSFLPEFKVKVPYFPLDSLEINILDSIQTRLKKLREISSSFLNDSHLNILKLSDPDIQYHYEVVRKISETYLNPLERMLAYRESDIVEFATREKLIHNLWPEGLPSKELTVTIEVDSVSFSRTFELPDADNYKFEDYDMTSMDGLSRYAENSLHTVEEILGAKLTQEKNQQELIALEKELLAQNNELQQLIDSTQHTLGAAYKKALGRIKAVSDKKLSDFSSKEEVNSGRELVVCYKRMNLLAKSVAALPTRSKEIATVYNDRIWNPFMATLMDEEVKKRITNAYRQVLVPHFLERIQTDLSCENAGELTTQIENTVQRILQLREEDTSKVERKLRKEQDPQVVLQLFDVQPMTEEN